MSTCSQWPLSGVQKSFFRGVTFLMSELILQVQYIKTLPAPGSPLVACLRLRKWHFVLPMQ
eukprot:1017611-Amphidinium_carterae.1